MNIIYLLYIATRLCVERLYEIMLWLLHRRQTLELMILQNIVVFTYLEMEAHTRHVKRSTQEPCEQNWAK